MKPNELTALWQQYASSNINMELHESDQMLDSKYGMEGYKFVGLSGARVIWAALAMAEGDAAPKRILDFGSGAGRVARHIRALFPEAELFFSDFHTERADFCAQQFHGTAVEAPADFTKLKLPPNLDLIWVGSLFTHIDYKRMGDLFDALWASLSPRGVLVATFHGQVAVERSKTEAFIAKDRWADICRDYRRVGVGYRSYAEVGYLGQVGVSVTKPEAAMALASTHPDARLLAYSEGAWATLQDVIAWQKR